MMPGGMSRRTGGNLEENTSERRFFMHFSLNLYCGHVEANVEVDAVTEIADRVCHELNLSYQQVGDSAAELE